MLRLPRLLHVKKQVNTLITMEGRTGDHRRQPQTTQQPEPLTEHGGSQSAAPATNSAHQETSEYSNHNGGTDRRPPQTTADNATARASDGAWRFTSAAPATNSARQETSEYSNHNGGTDRRPPQTAADNATARASNGGWRFTKCCACHEFCTSRNK